MADNSLEEKHGNRIQEGDTVSTAYRGGKREGLVEAVVTDAEQAKQEDVKNPPKVVFPDQHGHRVAHNPETLTKKD
ncbi:hypothetical protein MMC08_005989 [Hypocenomyce scalaris]|nr:hypothetical protein [Hypocenomyce scalaris]